MWSDELFANAPAQSFRDWPDVSLPRWAAGVYTIWHESSFLYVGMAGARGVTEGEILVKKQKGKGKSWGLRDRLGSHASGRRSGDQFCVYVADRFILPALTPLEIDAIADRSSDQTIDDQVKRYVRERFSFRYWESKDGLEASRVEDEILSGGSLELVSRFGRPLLNSRHRDGMAVRTRQPAS